MKTSFRDMSNDEIVKAIQIKIQELIGLRNELSKRKGETIPTVDYDFTKRVTD